MAIHKFTAPSNGMLYQTDLSTKIIPGDTVILQGNFLSVYMKKMYGTAENPINIIIENPINVTGNGNYGVIVTGKHFNFYGNGFLNVGGQTTLNQLFGFEDSSHILIDGVNLRNAAVGFFGNDAKLPGIRENITIRNSNVEEIKAVSTTSPTAEAIYLGNTGLKTLATASWKDITIDNVKCRNVEGDGIQIAAAQNVKINNCLVENYGIRNISGQKFGILVGGCSQAEISNCIIQNGSGGGIHIYGKNKTIVKDTKLINTGNGTITDDAVYIEKKCLDLEPLSVFMQNVEIDGANRNGVRNVNTAAEVVLRDVVIKNTKSTPTSGLVKIETTPPPTPTPTPTPTKKALYVMYDDGTWGPYQ